jgi:homoserine dehydrogenase
MRLDLALVGFGHVGRRFVRLAAEIENRLQAEHDLTLRIVGIATGRHGVAFDDHGLDAAGAAAIVERGEALSRLDRSGAQLSSGVELIERFARPPRAGGAGRVVIETTPLDVQRARPAIDHIRAALGAGIDVVTANKGPVAIAWRELRDLAAARDASFLFEGAVMDGIPIFNLLRETLPGVRVTGFRGVVNSTTNHILTMLEDGGEFEPALAEMQQAGVAEADPGLDVDGWDAAAKAAALANVLMDAGITPADVERTGIRGVSGDRVRAAVARGHRIRLVASAARDRGPVAARVRPEELPAGDPLAILRGMANALVLRTDLLGEIAVTQLAGGLTQTAYALVTDLVTVARRRQSR